MLFGVGDSDNLTGVAIVEDRGGFLVYFLELPLPAVPQHGLVACDGVAADKPDDGGDC